MNNAASTIFLNLINLAIRMMPIFICLEPKYGSRENIAAVSVYLWVIMVSLQSVFSIPQTAFSLFQAMFSALFFLVLLVLFRGKALKKAFLYISAWLFSVLFSSLGTFAAWLLRDHIELSYAQISLMVASVTAAGFYFFVKYWLKARVQSLFTQLSTGNGTLILAVPSLFLILLYLGSNSIFSEDTLLLRGAEDILFYLALCSTILALYIILIVDTLRIIERRKTQTELQFAKQLISRQRDHYNQMLDYWQQIRIIKHDFRHHIHALLHMEKDEQTRYLQNLKKEFDAVPELVFCRNQAINSLLQEYAVRTKQEAIDFSVQISLSDHIPVDDLTLCIVIGNLLENALEACRKIPDDRFIRLQARWDGDHLRMLVKNSFDGQIKQGNNRIISSKTNGGLGMLSIRRILNQPGDDFDVYYTDDTFTAMISITDRTTD